MKFLVVYIINIVNIWIVWHLIKLFCCANAALFNIIINGLILSSFFSILSIMLSDNIINRIKILENYPRILKLLKLRNNINKKVSKFYLLMHLIFIVLGILGNIYMFFI